MLRRMDRISVRHRIATRLERFLDHQRRWTGQALAFLVGMVINTALNPGLKDPANPFAILAQVYDDRRISGYLAWVVTIAVVTLAGARPALERYTRKWNWLGVLAQTVADARDPDLSWLDDGILAWGTEVMLQSPPDLRDGWKADSVELAVSQSVFKMPATYAAAYRRFVKAQNAADPQRIAARERKYALARSPVSFSDNPSLRLEVRETEYANVLFYKDKVAPDHAQRSALARAAVSDGRVEFPNNLSLHAVITTSDGKLLLTRRSSKVEYFPGRWSCSIEEQLAARDLHPDDGAAVRRWVTRMLTEELGFRRQTLEQWFAGDARILGVFLEASILNCGLVGLVNLGCDSTTLTQILRTHPRNDYEFDEFTFIGWREIARELITPSRGYHPTSGIRMLMAGIAHFGPLAFIERLVDARVS
jgi:isopentenyldiphosphate isomerase